MTLLIKSTPENRKLVFNAIKAKILKHLEELEREESGELKKTFSELTGLLLKGGKGLPVGTIREWKGKKFIKVAPGKWKPKYDSETRGAKLAVSALKKKIERCEDEREMMRLVLENRDRFSDKNGNPLPFVQQLSEFISQTQEKKAGEKTANKKAAISGEDDGEPHDNFKGKKIKNEIEKLLDELNPNGGNERGFQFSVADLGHLKSIKSMINDFENNPPTENDRERLEEIVNSNRKQARKLQKIYESTGDKNALVGAQKYIDFANFYNWQLSKLDKIKFSQDFTNLAEAVKNSKDFSIESRRTHIGNVFVESGETGKSGYGIKHIIEQRYKKDGKNVDEITALLPLVLDSVRNGKITRENDKSIELTKNGIVAIVAKQKFGKEMKWVLTGFESTNNKKEKQEAEDAIATVIANNDYALERSYFRRQVGAVIASLSSIPQSGEKSSLFELDNNKKDKTAANVPEYAYKDVLESVNHRSFEDAVSFLKERVAEFSESIEKYSFYKDDSKYIDKLNAYKKVLAEFTTDKSIWAKTHIERKKKDIELNNERIEGWKKDIESYKKKLVEVEKAPADSRFKFPKEKTLHTKQYTIKYYKELIDRCNSDIKECEERNAKFKKDIQTAEVLIDKKTNTKKQRNDKRTKKQALIDHIKHLTNIDLSEYVDDESPKRKYLNIVWNKIPENDQNTIRRIAHQYGKFTLEQNGYSRMALFYGDKLNTDEKPHLTKSIVWLQNYLSKSGQKKESAIEVLRKRLEKERRV